MGLQNELQSLRCLKAAAVDAMDKFDSSIEVLAY
jgi:hypothetical protein